MVMFILTFILEVFKFVGISVLEYLLLLLINKISFHLTTQIQILVILVLQIKAFHMNFHSSLRHLN